jgi:hypothetical protein
MARHAVKGRELRISSILPATTDIHAPTLGARKTDEGMVSGNDLGNSFLHKGLTKDARKRA